jgi:prophage maintenance system killer protein
LREIRAKEADQHRVLSRQNIEDAVRSTTEAEGDVYDKAATLLSELVRGHAFASGVRRTAFTATISFLKTNGANPRVVHAPKVLMGIRERFYSQDEVKDWLKGNEIRKFARG